MGARRKKPRSSEGESPVRSLTGLEEKIASFRKTNKRLTLVIASQPALFREVLCRFLNGVPGFHVVGEAFDEEQINQRLSQKRPQVLLFDYEALGPNGEAAIARVRRAAPGTRILVLTTRSSEETVQRVLRAGGSGVVGKQLGSATLVRAIHAVATGQVWANRQTVGQTLEHLANPGREVGLERQLTKREWEVVDDVSRGLRNKEIARRLTISEKTVKSHLNNIFRKLQVDNRFALGLYAWELTRARA